MNKEPFNLEFNKIIKGLSNVSAPSTLKFEQDFYKKLRNFFLIGDSYYFVINHQSLAMEFVSNEIEDVLGYHPYEFNMQFMNGKLHPDDRSCFLSFGNSIVDFFSKLSIEKMMKYKVRYDIRFRKRDGDYAR